MGSLFGGTLAIAGHDVTLVDIWEEHVQTLNEDGLTISTQDGDDRIIDITATTDATTVDSVDLMMVFVKSIHTESAIEDAAPILDEDTDVLTVQNGLGNAEAIAAHVPEDRIIGGVTSQGSILEGPGHITHAGESPTTIGRYFTDNGAAVERIADAFTKAGIETDVTESVRDVVWEKVLVNLGINAATGLARVTNGAIEATDPGRNLAEAAVSEGKAVAEDEGRTIRDDIFDHVLEISEETAPNKSSMRQDLEADRVTEIEKLNGVVVQRAERHGIETPVNRTLTQLVRLAEQEFEADA